ncbi:MAG: hypothetical protein K2L38_02400 [Dysosmobacter sp.]|nr:hypothetical protein [Dysosmobacter sp.]
MKQKKFRMFLLTILTVSLLATCAYAAGDYQTANVPIGSSSEVVMDGDIQPTLMSVTIPAYVPFTVSRALEGSNKVISPRITMSNLSGTPVTVNVAYARVDLSGLRNTAWSSSGIVQPNQIAVGFQPETVENQLPVSQTAPQWLAQGPQSLNIADLYAYSSSTVYVVGALGDQVPGEGSFTVIPTFVVRPV